MRLEHVIITRFSYRSEGLSSGGRNRRSYDPLKPANLEHRLRLFEIVSLPSVLAQTEQDFAWVIMIDRNLQPKYRAKLSALVASRPRTSFHEFDPTTDRGAAGWLTPYLRPMDSGDYLVTTDLDDDDALPGDFVAALQAAVRERVGSGIPLLFLGACQITEWDLLISDRAPLGWTAQWHRRSPYGGPVASCGFSLASRQPDYPFTVVAQIHMLARQYLDFASPPTHRNVEEARRRFRDAARIAGDDLEAHSPEDTFLDISAAVGPVLMTNHSQNLQATRLFEEKANLTAVSGPETFAAFSLDWEALERHRRHFRGSLGLSIRRQWWRTRLGAARFSRRVGGKLRKTFQRP